MFVLGLRYLRGYAVATSDSSFLEAEWPPHPGRVFMAMVSAWGETGRDDRERLVLEWLETLPAPVIHASEADRRSIVTCWVPANDKVVSSGGLHPFSAIPEIHKKAERTFPAVRPHDDTVFFAWPGNADGCPDTEALDRLCEKTTRVGHSSSLVQLWVTDESSLPGDSPLKPDASVPNMHLRVVRPGTLASLEECFARGVEPRLGYRVGYAREETESQTATHRSIFDPNPIILTKRDGPVLGLESTAQLTRTLRDAILSLCPNPVPEWISGHQGGPSQAASELPHIALVPLPYVGTDYADGHILGLALFVPRETAQPEANSDSIRRCLGPVLFDTDIAPPRPRVIKLFPKPEGQRQPWEWTLTRETSDAPALALRPESWTSASTEWASVTPIILHRFPKKNRRTSRAAWNDEVAGIVAASCEFIGLPRPTWVRADRVSMLRGAPPSSDFPPLPTKSGKNRVCVHAAVRFAEPVTGPVLLGAGRYLGYGLMKPLPPEREDRNDG